MRYKEFDLEFLNPAARFTLFSQRILLGLVFDVNNFTSLQHLDSITTDLKGSGTIVPVIYIGTRWDQVSPERQAERLSSIQNWMVNHGNPPYYLVSAISGYNMHILVESLATIAIESFGSTQADFTLVLVGDTGTGKSELLKKIGELMPPIELSEKNIAAPSQLDMEEVKEKLRERKAKEETELAEMEEQLVLMKKEKIEHAKELSNQELLKSETLSLPSEPLPEVSSTEEMPKEPPKDIAASFSSPPPPPPKVGGGAPISPLPSGVSTSTAIPKTAAIAPGSPPSPAISPPLTTAPSPPPSAMPPPPMMESDKSRRREPLRLFPEKKALSKPAVMAKAKAKSEMKEEEHELDETPEIEAEEKMAPMDDFTGLSAGESVKPSEEPIQYHKNLAVEYFDKMNPEKYYPIIVDIADIEQATIAPEENIFTGERKIQKKETMEVELKSPRVTVRPIFPGCSITPSEQITYFTQKQDKLTFYITPLVKDTIQGHIDFQDIEGKVVYRLPLKAKVDDPRYAKTVAAYGTLASVVPKILMFFGIDWGENVNMETLLPLLTSISGDVIGGMKLNNFVAFFGVIIAVVIGSIIFLTRQPRSTKKRFTLGDIRMAKIGEIH